MNAPQDPYEFEEDAMGENFRFVNDEIDYNGRINRETPLDIAATMRGLRVELQSCREEK